MLVLFGIKMLPLIVMSLLSVTGPDTVKEPVDILVLVDVEMFACTKFKFKVPVLSPKDTFATFPTISPVDPTVSVVPEVPMSVKGP